MFAIAHLGKHMGAIRHLSNSDLSRRELPQSQEEPNRKLADAISAKRRLANADEKPNAQLPNSNKPHRDLADGDNPIRNPPDRNDAMRRDPLPSLRTNAIRIVHE